VRDRIAEFLRERTPSRAIALGVFLGLLAFFRHLLLLLTFYVVFQRLLQSGAAALGPRLGLSRKLAVGLVALVLLAVSSAGAAFLAVHATRAAIHARQTIPARIEALKTDPAYASVLEYLPDADDALERVQHYAAGIFHALSAIGHALAYALVGFILALVSVLEEDELREFRESLDPRTLRATLLRWLGFLSDAMLITVQFQCVVAGCNAALTFPVLLLVGIQHAPALALLIFASGLVPVVGNFVMGVVLSLLAYQAKGWLGVGIFVVLTFILHKLESYYLNPRLASRHVRLPSFVLIVSLVLWEHALGLAGLFVSFPFLYVAQKIRNEMMSESAPAAVEPAVRIAPG
jgi:predicted PurR-regulated permease PerM